MAISSLCHQRSLGTVVRLSPSQRVEIATAPAGPRDDRKGALTIINNCRLPKASLHRWLHEGGWQPRRQNPRPFIRLLCALLFLLFLLTSCTHRESEGLGPGQLAPDLVLADYEGLRSKLSQFRGKVVVLNFWATWCEPCKQEMPLLENMYQSLKDKGLVVVAVGVDDDPANLKGYVEKEGLSFPTFLDAENKSRFRYKISGFPESFIIDREGKITMFLDPNDDEPVTRLTGPRSWDSPVMLQRLAALL